MGGTCFRAISRRQSGERTTAANLPTQSPGRFSHRGISRSPAYTEKFRALLRVPFLLHATPVQPQRLLELRVGLPLSPGKLRREPGRKAGSIGSKSYLRPAPPARAPAFLRTPHSYRRPARRLQ